MPKLKIHLNAVEQREQFAVANRLKAAGCDIDVADRSSSEQALVRISQQHHFFSNCATVLSTGGTAYTIPVAIVSETSRLVIRSLDLTLPWEDANLFLLPDPTISSRAEIYRLPNGETFDRRDVLNHRVGSAGGLLRGQLIEGIVLALGRSAIPDQYPHGSTVSATLVLTDQFEKIYEKKIGLWVNRREHRQCRPRERRSFSRRSTEKLMHRL